MYTLTVPVQMQAASLSLQTSVQQLIFQAIWEDSSAVSLAFEQHFRLI